MPAKHGVKRSTHAFPCQDPECYGPWVKVESVRVPPTNKRSYRCRSCRANLAQKRIDAGQGMYLPRWKANA